MEAADPIEERRAERQPLVLLVNPSSGGGRALKLLPRVEAAARRPPRPLPRRPHQEPRPRRRQSAAGGRGGRAAGGDQRRRDDRRDRRRAGGRRDAARHRPRRPRQRPRPRARHPDRARRRRSRSSSPATAARSTSARSTASASSASPASASTPTPTGIANEARLRGNLVYAYAALRTMATWKSARFTIAIGDEHTRVEGYSVIVANNKAYGGGMFIAPDAELDDGEFDVVTIGRHGQAPGFLGNLPKVFKGTHVRRSTRCRSCAPPGSASAPAAPSRSTPTAST